MSSFKLYTDGASSGNPGPSGVGVIIKDEKENIVKKVSREIGDSTNNIAEYTALIIGLIESRLLGVEVLDVFLDSELLVKQCIGKYKIKSINLKPLNYIVRYIGKDFKKISFTHIPREKNKEADKLAQDAARPKDIFSKI